MNRRRSLQITLYTQPKASWLSRLAAPEAYQDNLKAYTMTAKCLELCLLSFLIGRRDLQEFYNVRLPPFIALRKSGSRKAEKPESHIGDIYSLSNTLWTCSYELIDYVHTSTRE